MSFRTRLFIAFLFAGIVPVMLLAYVVRNEMTSRLTEQHIAQVNELAGFIKQDLEGDYADIEAALVNIQAQMLDDNRLRSALLDRSGPDRRYLLDYAGVQMGLSGLSVLQLQDSEGRILSSGHFRNEYDRIDNRLSGLLNDEVTLMVARSPEGFFEVLASAAAFSMGGQAFTLVGGLSIDSVYVANLSRTSELTVSVNYPEGNNTIDKAGPAGMLGSLSYPYLDADRAENRFISFVVTHNQAGLLALRESVNRWFMIVGGFAALISILVLTWTSSRISRPIQELSDKTARLDLEKLDVNFSSDRKDEIGHLSRLLGKMTDRLRRSKVLIKEAERKAAIGDLARQVNHDIKNGLTPLRNVFRHLAQLAESNPQEIPQVFAERKETVSSSIDYLQGLAGNYARLTPRVDRVDCDLNALIRLIVKDKRALVHTGLQTRLSKRAVIKADALSLRRIIENLVDNGIDSLEGKQGKVAITTEVVRVDGEGDKVRLIIEDNGIGMSEEQKNKVFQDFYTTKDKGTGLGLSIVRRLVMDLDGSIRVESEPGQGARFILDLPAA